MASLGSHWSLVDVIGCNLHNWCDSRTFDRTKLNMFNPCDPGRNRCRMYGCTCSCSCMFVYTVRSPRRSRVCLHGAIAATIASCKHRITARQSNSGRQPNFAALNTGRHLYSAGRPSRWTLAHIPVTVVLKLSFSFYRVIRLLSRKNVKNICICICIIDKLYTMTTSSDDT